MIDAVTTRPVPDRQKLPAAPKQAFDLEAFVDDRVRADRAALDQVSRAITDSRRGRKEAARAEVDRLKKQMDLLRLLGATNPKALARQLAQLARELGMAARSYAEGGNDVDVTAPASANADASVASPTSEAPATPEQASQAATQAVMKTYADNQATADRARADATFAADVRALQRQIKAMLEEARRRAADKHDDGAVDDAAKAVSASDSAIDQALGPELIVAIATETSGPVNVLA